MALLGNEKNRGCADTFAKVVRWMTLIAGVLTAILGFISICTKNASLSVADGHFADDGNNKGSWRMALFSFAPAVFVDTWTPMVMGVVTTLFNFQSFKLPIITQNFARLFLWLFLVAMFGNLGYAGGVGIIIGSYTLLVDLLCLIAALIHDGPANLDLAMPNKFGGKNSNGEAKVVDINV